VSEPAPGRYCLAVCYCGECPHFKPLTRTSERDDLGPSLTIPPRPNAWADREESTWIDKL
jgi:hypothetical protein